MFSKVQNSLTNLIQVRGYSFHFPCIWAVRKRGQMNYEFFFFFPLKFVIVKYLRRINPVQLFMYLLYLSQLKSDSFLMDSCIIEFTSQCSKVFKIFTYGKGF